jgi:hypothetical protein
MLSGISEYPQQSIGEWGPHSWAVLNWYTDTFDILVVELEEEFVCGALIPVNKMT